MEATEECTYCTADVTPLKQTPAKADDEAWDKAAKEHLPSCEWVRTRAHRID